MRNKVSPIGLIFFICIGVLPFFAAFIYALLYSFGLLGGLNSGFTTVFWETVFKNDEFMGSFLYSILVAGTALLFSVGGALWVVLRFRRELNGRFLSFIMYLPLAIPGVVAGFFMVQLFSKGGLFARICYHLGFIDTPAQFPDLVNDSLAIGIIMAFITIVMPFFVLLFLNVYKNERVQELSVLANSLGATQNQVIRRVFLPIILKKTWVLITLYFIFLLGAYEVPLILGQESPQMLSVLIIKDIKPYDLTKISIGYVEAVVYTLVVSAAALLLFLPKRKSSYAK